MYLPLGFWDTSLLLAVTALVLFITSEMLSPYYGRTSIYINRKRLRNAALSVSVLFLATVAIRVIGLLAT